MESSAAIGVVRRFVDALNRHDWGAIEALLHPDFRRHSDAAGAPGVESGPDLLRFLREEHRAYPDAREELLDVRVRSVYIAIYEIVDGSIRESWAEWDNLSDLRQLGHLPEAGA